MSEENPDAEELKKALAAIYDHCETTWSSTSMGRGGIGGQAFTAEPHTDVVRHIAFLAVKGLSMKEIADKYAENNPGCSRLDEPSKHPLRAGPDGRPV